MMREIQSDEAKQIWDRLVPEKEVWTDDWDIRMAICRQYGYKPLILYDGKNFFPLQLDPERGFYELLGGESVERNYVTFDPEFMKKTDKIPKNIYFDFLDERFEGCIEGLCPQFFLDLTRISSIDDYIKRFSKAHQKNFKRECRRFGSYEFLKRGTLADLAELNRRKFKKDSDFADDGIASYALLDKDPRTEYWSVVKDGETASITQFFFYNRTMSTCIWGIDERYGNSIKIILTEAITLAKSRDCTKIDFAPTYSDWKFFYRLDTSPLWRYKRGDIPDSVETTDYGIPPDERVRLKAEGRL
ncbi:MAG: hypothetical protein V1861_05205 [Candidatus Micrarchaeota archaeon]